MPDSFKTFRDPLLSLYQSAVTEVAKKIDQSANVSITSRAGARRSMVSTLPDVAAGIAEREYNRSTGGVAPVVRSDQTARELSKTGMAQVCAEWGFRYLKAVASRDDQAIAQLKDEFTAGTCDPAWLTTLEAYQSYLGEGGKRKAVPYVHVATVGPKTIEIKSNARVALMGDWGTGAPPAINVLKYVAGDNPDLFVHLGAIYYSGTHAECQSN